MLELVQQGGWLMVPIILCSIIALGISIERFVTLRTVKVAPKNLLAQVWGWIKNNQLDADKISGLKENSPLGEILAAGLANSRHGRDIMKEAIQESASHVVHEMERYLNALGTVAAIAPLLGLLGTVLGMIDVFIEITQQGTGNAGALAGGISEALVTTASGLIVAIPALVCHRIFHRRIDELVVYMEQESIKLVDVLHGDREVAEQGEAKK